jgi:hypothetical protein
MQTNATTQKTRKQQNKQSYFAKLAEKAKQFKRENKRLVSEFVL